MTLMRYGGGPEVDTLRREMDRLMESFLPSRNLEERASNVWAPRADLSETDDHYILSMDLPGIKADDVEVTFEDGMLNISGERSVSKKEEGGQYHRIERSYGQFFRSFRFGENADPDGIEADFDDGVLSIRVPKREASKPRRIEVGRKLATDGAELQTN